VNGGGSGAGTAVTSQPRVQPTANIYIGGDPNTSYLTGFIQDVRVMTGSIVPVTTFTPQTGPFTTAPTYRTGMDTGYTSNLTMALNSQYFPGASTSPYGPCLTLPGTVGSYYSAANSAYDTNWKTNGFCLEAWVNYASLASSNTFNVATLPLSIGHMTPTGATTDWTFGATTTGQLAFWYYTGTATGVSSAASAITTGQWTHVMVQSNGTNIWLAINGTLVSAAGTAISGNPVITAGAPIAAGQLNNITGPNFAIAKARLVFGTSGSPSLGNVYSSGNFTANPNFATVPAGATVAWQLDSQYPLPTYPSIQDVTELPQQASSYGALPTPVGGVTSSVLGPYSSYPQLDSIRFDGTGYIDYGNAASSVMTTNLWANAWTIEGWVYLASAPSNYPGFISFSNASTYDWVLYVNAGNPAQVSFAYGKATGTSVFNAGSLSVSPGTWTHVAATYDGARSNVYVGGFLSNSMVATTTNMTFNPSFNLLVGSYQFASQPLNGNLADVRVSNVARYTGSTYTVPNVADGSGPFVTDRNTLLLLKSLAGQVGTTLEVQGRGLNAVSLGATRSVQSYPPAPMSSYLLDTTSNASVTYGQGKYVASASSDSYTGSTNYAAWQAFTKTFSASTGWVTPVSYSSASPYGPTSSTVTIDTLGNSYPGEWLQLQVPVSVILSNYQLNPGYGSLTTQVPVKWWLLGSRDGINWTLVNSVVNYTAWAGITNSTFTVGATQGYNYYRLVVNQLVGNATIAVLGQMTLNGTEESLCVTSDAKVGVGIANPQRTMEIAGDLVVSGTISGGAGMGSFRNRIINGDMRIAQRGTSNVLAATGGSQYYPTVDRWAIATGTLTSVVTITQSTLTASDAPYQQGLRNASSIVVNSAGTSTTFSFWQVIEGYNAQDLNWGTSFGSPVTFSFWVKASITGNYTFHIISAGIDYSYLAPYTVVNPNTWEYKTLTIPPPPNGSTWGTGANGWGFFQFRFVQPSASSGTTGWQAGVLQKLYGTVNLVDIQGATWAVTGVQLEKGTVATPFEFRPYATELALCQRYYQQFNCTSGGGSSQPFGTGLVSTSTSIYTMTPLIVPMRTNSTLSSNSAPSIFTIGTGAASFAPTSMSLSAASTNQVYLNWVVSGATVNLPAVVQANGTTSAFLGFSAEL
jgi:hypothetical protein